MLTRPPLLACLALVPLALAGGIRRSPKPSLAAAAVRLRAPGDTVRRLAVARPRAPFVLSDICPGDCCQLGTWTANTRLKVRAEPTDSAAVAYYMAPSSTFEALSSDLHVEQLGVVVVRRNKVISDEDGVRRVFRPGDTLLVQGDLGDGIALVWFRGEDIALDGLWWPLDQDEPAPAASAQAELRRPLVARWWVKVSQAGREGWLEMTESVDVSGRDACG